MTRPTTPARHLRHRLAPLTVLGLVLAGPVGAAVAEDQTPSGSPSESPSASPPAAPSAGLDAADPNQPPVANPDTAAVTAGSSVRIPVLANDTDDGLGRPEGEPPRLEVTAATGPSGTTSFTADSVTYRAPAGTSGKVALTYVVSDGSLTAEGQVTVTVTAPVTRSVSITMASTPVALRSYQIRGKVQPPVPGPVEVRVQRRTPDGWVGYRTTRADAQGSYAVGFRTDLPAKRTFRAVAIWKDGRRATSATMTRTTVGRADAKVSGPLTRSQVPYSYRSGCPVPPSKLRKISINRWNYDNRVARGSVVVRASEAGDITNVLTAAFNGKFPIRTLKPSDAFYLGGRRTPSQSDVAAMKAGNTSAFNCRPVTGNPYRISQHSYGNAIDINTIENPYVTGSRVYPSTSGKYLKRSPYRRGMILRDGVVATRMRNLGWLWGARWSHPDYQHFSSNGG